jgi:hypothetical protein
MDIFGIGPLEFILILLIALIILGPNDMAKAGRSLGRFLRRMVMSDEWRIITQSAREFRHLPNQLIREAGIEEIKKELPDIRRDADLDGLNRELREWQQDVSSWTKQPETDEAEVIAPVQARSSVSTRPGTSQPKKFSWDDPDILPEEETNP